MDKSQLWRLACQSADSGETGAAYLLCLRLLRDNPADAGALHLGGLLLTAGNHAGRGIRLLTRALRLRPRRAAWHHDLGAACLAADRPRAAAAAFRACLAINPRHADARAALPEALLESGKRDAALAEAQRAAKSVPASPIPHRVIACVLAGNDRTTAARQAFARALRADPANWRTIEAAARFEFDSGQESRAESMFRRLLQLSPDQRGAWAGLAGARLLFGDLAAALDALEHAVALDPANAHLHSVLLHTSLMDPARDGARVLAGHRRWPESHSPHPARRRSYSNDPDPRRRIRLGYVTGEFSRGSASFFLPAFLRHHNRAAFELFAYNARPAPPVAPDPIAAVFDHWREAGHLDDNGIAGWIRRDRIDILVDVSGHLPHGRPGVFARRPAPVQVAYPRYPASTGLDTISHRFTDAWADPPGSAADHYTEQLLPLPGGYLAYEPPAGAPPVEPLAPDAPLFGFFQTPLKLNAAVFDAIAAALRAAPPAARILFHYSVHDYDRPGRPARTRIEREMAARGVGRDRLLFRGPLPLAEHLHLVNSAGIALDSFPYNGQTTTCECLWMGVPVVTLAGERFSSRVTAAILKRCGLEDWVASNVEEYAAMAARAAHDRPLLTRLRASLRRRIAVSPLCDGARLAREMETAYRRLWSEWCASSKSVNKRS